MRSSLSSPITPRTALIALNAVSGLAPRTAFKLSQQEDFWPRLLNTSSEEAARALNISEKAVINLVNFPARDFKDQETARAEALGCRIVTILDDDYPLRLRDITDPPIVLYVQGSIPASDEVVLAIVGSRLATSYGLGIAERFAMRIVEAGAAVISGMARGIDAAAHKGALKARGRTIGVLGCGLDIVYPVQNKELYSQVAERGCLISEFPLGAEPYPYNFPRRNRIVSALSHGVVVVEANIRSGALITAEFALEQGREVYAVPGHIDSLQSRGPHELVRHGAKLIMSVEDIFEDIPALQLQPELFPVGKPVRPVKPADLTNDELKVITILDGDECSFDSLVARSGLPVPVLMGVCLSLQLRRLVRELPGKVYKAVSLTG
ncbi:MAG: DNA-protecting protein DprA [Candidatus Omnitrophica bacterium]|nr:DNA-protecting protein DprA [Candidatus Omnitrophota bacterium]